MRAFLVFLLLLAWDFEVRAEAGSDAAPELASSPEWELLGEEDGVKFYKGDVDYSEYRAFKGETVIDAPLRRVLGVVCENEHRTEWVHRLEKSEILERISDHDYFVYQHFRLPVIITDRDFVYHARAVRAPGGVVMLLIESVEHEKAPETVGIRGHLEMSRYVLTPLEDGKTHVAVEIVLDPKGWMPVWFANVVAKTWPRRTLNGIRAQVKKDHVRDYPLPPALPADREPVTPAPAPRPAAPAPAR